MDLTESANKISELLMGTMGIFAVGVDEKQIIVYLDLHRIESIADGVERVASLVVNQPVKVVLAEQPVVRTYNGSF